MSHSCRTDSSAAMRVVCSAAAPRQLGSVILIAALCSCACAHAGDLPESSPLVAYASVSLVIPDPSPSALRHTPLLPATTQESSSSTSIEKASEPPPAIEADAESRPPTPDLTLDLWLNQFTYSDEPQRQFVLRTARSESWFGDEELVLLRKKMPSRYAYDSWANLKTGYGRVFPDEAIARSRTGGAGVEDPDWVYVKMTFRF